LFRFFFHTPFKLSFLPKVETRFFWSYLLIFPFDERDKCRNPPMSWSDTRSAELNKD
jgi:hypothetical protein